MKKIFASLSVLCLLLWIYSSLTDKNLPNDWINLAYSTKHETSIKSELKKHTIQFKYTNQNIFKVRRIDFYKSLAHLCSANLLEETKIYWQDEVVDPISKERDLNQSISGLTHLIQAMPNVRHASFDIHSKAKYNYLNISFLSEISILSFDKHLVNLIKLTLPLNKELIIVIEFDGFGNKYSQKAKLSNNLAKQYLHLEHKIIRQINMSIANSSFYIDIQSDKMSQTPVVKIGLANTLLTKKQTIDNFNYLKQLVASVLHKESIHNFKVYIESIEPYWIIDHKIYSSSKRLLRFQAKLFTTGILLLSLFILILCIKIYREKQLNHRQNTTISQGQNIFDEDTSDDKDQNLNSITPSTKIESLIFINSHFESCNPEDINVVGNFDSRVDVIDPIESCNACTTHYTEFIVKDKYLHCPNCKSIYGQSVDNRLFLAAGPLFNKKWKLISLWITFTLSYFNLVCLLYQFLNVVNFETPSILLSTIYIVFQFRFIRVLLSFSNSDIVIPKQANIIETPYSDLLELLVFFFMLFLSLWSLIISLGEFPQ